MPLQQHTFNPALDDPYWLGLCATCGNGYTATGGVSGLPIHKAHTEEIEFAGGKAQSSASPDLQYISTEALFRLADRCTLGVKNKGDKAWNAVSKNQEVLADREFVLNRLSHGIKHLLLLRDKVLAGKPMDGDDDAAAVMWIGMFLCCATKALNPIAATEELTPDDGTDGPFSKALFHRLWDRAVGTEHYNKADWLDLQRRLGF